MPLSAEVSESGLSGMGAAHTVRAGARWRGGRTDVHTGCANVIRRQRDSRTKDQLAKILGACHDVAADEVWVVEANCVVELTA
jgi:hypothetical protein